MKLEENTMLRAPRHIGGDPSPAPMDLSTWVVRSLPGEADKFLATAPGRLDVLGGFADYTGGLVLSMPLAQHACVGAEVRTDGLLRIVHFAGGDESAADVCEIPLAHFRTSAGDWISGSAAAELMKPWSQPVRCCAGAVIEAMRRGLLAGSQGGYSLAVASDLEEIHGSGFIAAVCSAALTSLAATGQENLGSLDAVSICLAVENEWLNNPTGPADALCALLGESQSLSQLRCENRTVGGTMRIPCGLRIVAIDCGFTQPDHPQKFTQVRTAAFMGRLLIERIVQHDGLLSRQWDGHLSRISVNDFVERIRDRLPMKMSGKEFLDRFGETGDKLTKIDPAHIYKVRSRTEHHVYEHARSRQFVEALSRGGRNSDRSAFVEAGTAMNASHWSYGQRCGMGNVPVNSLVNCLRKADAGAGIFGARIAGRGCGGMVAVLAEDSHASQQAIEDCLDAYAREHHATARILTGSLPGAMLSAPLRV